MRSPSGDHTGPSAEPRARNAAGRVLPSLGARAPRVLENHATLAAEGAAVSSLGNKKVSTWSSVNGGCAPAASVAMRSANALNPVLLNRLDFRLLPRRVCIRSDQALVAIEADS